MEAGVRMVPIFTEVIEKKEHVNICMTVNVKTHKNQLIPVGLGGDGETWKRADTP